VWSSPIGGSGRELSPTARPRRSREEVERTKRRILEAALDLFNSHTYAEVSMRKVAARAGFSPAAIYNYYRNKDALYLDVLRSGFEMLHRSFLDGLDPEHPAAGLRHMAYRLYEFSRSHPTCYDLMFTLPVPKYLDYVGTDMEATAFDEKTVAVANFHLAEDVIRAGVLKGEFKQDLDPARAALTLLAGAHGVISLARSGVLAELGLEDEAAYAAVMEQLLRQLSAE